MQSLFSWNSTCSGLALLMLGRLLLAIEASFDLRCARLIRREERAISSAELECVTRRN